MIFIYQIGKYAKVMNVQICLNFTKVIGKQDDNKDESSLKVLYFETESPQLRDYII